MTVQARRPAVQVRSFFQNSERSFFVNELHCWLLDQHPGLRTFKILQLRLARFAADHPEQRAMCRLLRGVISCYVEQFDEAPLPTAVADRAYRRLLRTLAEFDTPADPARQLGELNRLAELDLVHQRSRRSPKPDSWNWIPGSGLLARLGTRTTTDVLPEAGAFGR
jgi:hypothetical protein